MTSSSVGLRTYEIHALEETVVAVGYRFVRGSHKRLHTHTQTHITYADVCNVCWRMLTSVALYRRNRTHVTRCSAASTCSFSLGQVCARTHTHTHTHTHVHVREKRRLTPTTPSPFFFLFLPLHSGPPPVIKSSVGMGALGLYQSESLLPSSSWFSIYLLY
jgi:hypothetical protein